MQSKRIKTALLCGGISPEHEVSLSSGETCARMLDPGRYDLLPICILKDGDWLIQDNWLGAERNSEHLDHCFNVFRQLGNEKIDGMQRLPVEHVLPVLKQKAPDLIFILLHGKGGEDGVIQGFLEFGGFPYTGPGVLASALAMDKVRCLHIMASRNYLTPPYVSRLELPPEPDFTSFIRVAEKKFGYPCFVKPARVGSSVGMSVARNHDELQQALFTARQFDSQIVIEEYITGVEVTCGVLDIWKEGVKSQRLILPPTEIVVKEADFFDYKSKYTPGLTEEITPARLPDRTLERIRETAGAIHQLIGCSGVSRIDMIVHKEEIFILECNTIPGMTPTSLLPQGAAAAGISFPHLLDIIIAHALYGIK